MPEGHTIHRLARDLTKAFGRQSIAASSPQGRFSDGAARLNQQHCDGFEAFGKHLVGHFADGDVLHVHLGLIGKFRRAKGEPRGAVRLRLSADEIHWDLRGPMVCTVGTPDLAEDVEAKIGPDPLRRTADPERFYETMRRRRIAVGAALLDQKIIAGIGNVYRAELLFIAGIDPRTPSNKLSDDQLERLWTLSQDQLRQGVRLNRIVTVDPGEGGFKNARAVPAGERLYAYKRAGKSCRRCANKIERLEVAGRKMWMCSKCQR